MNTRATVLNEAGGTDEESRVIFRFPGLLLKYIGSVDRIEGVDSRLYQYGNPVVH